MEQIKYFTLFIGYELPDDLDLKYSKAFSLLDKSYFQIDLQGDRVHLIPEFLIDDVRKLIEKINVEDQANLTCDFEEYDFLKKYEVNIWVNNKLTSLVVPSSDNSTAFQMALEHLELEEENISDYECFSMYEYA